jgi:hypothetical protein
LSGETAMFSTTQKLENLSQKTHLWI